MQRLELRGQFLAFRVGIASDGMQVLPEDFEHRLGRPKRIDAHAEIQQRFPVPNRAAAVAKQRRRIGVGAGKFAHAFKGDNYPAGSQTRLRAWIRSTHRRRAVGTPVARRAGLTPAADGVVGRAASVSRRVPHHLAQVVDAPRPAQAAAEFAEIDHAVLAVPDERVAYACR